MIDRDGTIYQLVPLDTICRHTVGLNWTAIGIEHVGTSDAEILAQPAPARGVAAADAVADAPLRHLAAERDRARESLTSRYHRERYAAVALPDARRLAARRHGRLPREARRARAGREHVTVSTRAGGAGAAQRC